MTFLKIFRLQISHKIFEYKSYRQVNLSNLSKKILFGNMTDYH